MRGLSERFATFYSTPRHFLLTGSIAYLTLMVAIRTRPSVFGAVITLAVLSISWRVSETSASERLPAAALLVVVSLSGIFNDFRLTGVVLAVALMSTPLIAATGNKRKRRLLRQALTMTVAWLPASLTGASLTILMYRESSYVGLLVSLIYIHDVGLGLGMRDRAHRHFAPVLGITGAVALLWTSVQISATPIPPEWFFPFAALVATAIPLGRVALILVCAEAGHDLKQFSSYFLITPLWVLAINVSAI